MGIMTVVPLIFFVAGVAKALFTKQKWPGWSFLDPGNAKIFQNRGGGGADSLLEAARGLIIRQALRRRSSYREASASGSWFR